MDKIRSFLRNDPNVYLGTDEQECRRFVAAVLWIDRSGTQWRLPPAAYGNWNTVYKRWGGRGASLSIAAARYAASCCVELLTG